MLSKSEIPIISNKTTCKFSLRTDFKFDLNYEFNLKSE